MLLVCSIHALQLHDDLRDDVAVDDAGKPTVELEVTSRSVQTGGRCSAPLVPPLTIKPMLPGTCFQITESAGALYEAGLAEHRTDHPIVLLGHHRDVMLARGGRRCSRTKL